MNDTTTIASDGPTFEDRLSELHHTLETMPNVSRRSFASIGYQVDQLDREMHRAKRHRLMTPTLPSDAGSTNQSVGFPQPSKKSVASTATAEGTGAPTAPDCIAMKNRLLLILAIKAIDAGIGIEGSPLASSMHRNLDLVLNSHPETIQLTVIQQQQIVRALIAVLSPPFVNQNILELIARYVATRGHGLRAEANAILATVGLPPVEAAIAADEVQGLGKRLQDM